jgi:hypothetical protein
MDVTKAPKMAEADPTKPGEEPASKVNYRGLKDWIAELEAYEATTGKPAPLTPAQSKAIAELSRAAQGPNPLTVNVDIGDKDFFGVINRKLGHLSNLTLLSTNPCKTNSCQISLTPTAHRVQQCLTQTTASFNQTNSSPQP